MYQKDISLNLQYESFAHLEACRTHLTAIDHFLAHKKPTDKPVIAEKDAVSQKIINILRCSPALDRTLGVIKPFDAETDMVTAMNSYACAIAAYQTEKEKLEKEHRVLFTEQKIKLFKWAGRLQPKLDTYLRKKYKN